MEQQIEITSLDLRYEGCRLRHAAIEKKWLASIRLKGIEKPLRGVSIGDKSVLLDGFKRLRCARQLKIEIVPYVSLGPDEATGIMSLLRASCEQKLGLLEEAAFVTELRKTLSAAEIADELSHCKSWVTMRVGLIGGLSPKVRELMFSGAFPVYAYMYTLKPYMSVEKREDIDKFVESVSGKHLSVRDIELLARGYFKGSDAFRQEVISGNVAMPLAEMKQAAAKVEGCSESEKTVLNDLERVSWYMQRITTRVPAAELKSKEFHVQSCLLTAGILSRAKAFNKTVRELNERNGKV